MPAVWPTKICSVWRHQMETFSSLIVLCTGIPPVIVGFPSHGPVRRGFDGSLICNWAIGWVNSDLRRHCSQHDVIVLCWRVGVERWSISTVVLYYEMLNTNVKYKHKVWPALTPSMNLYIRCFYDRKHQDYVYGKEKYRSTWQNKALFETQNKVSKSML